MTEREYQRRLKQVKENGATLCDMPGSNYFKLDKYTLCSLEVLGSTDDAEVAVTGPVLYSTCEAFTIEGAYRSLENDIIEDYEDEAAILDVVKKSDSLMIIIVGVKSDGRSHKTFEWAIMDSKTYSELYTHTIELE